MLRYYQRIGITDTWANLKEFYISSEERDKELLIERVTNLKAILPDCIVYVNYERY